MFNFLKTLRDAGIITDEQLVSGNAEFDAVIKPLRIKADKALELEKFVSENESLKTQIEELKTKKTTPSGEHEAKFKGLENQLKELTDSLAKEKTAKIEAIKKSELSKIVGSIDGLDPHFKKVVEFELSQVLKIGEDGAAYFDRDGTSIDQKGFMEEFVKSNTSMILPKGSTGNGSTGGYNSGKKESEMTLTELTELHKSK
jgi:hypothetical protein